MSGRVLRSRVLALAPACVLLAAGRAEAIDGAVIVYGLHTPSEEGFRRLLDDRPRSECAAMHASVR